MASSYFTLKMIKRKRIGRTKAQLDEEVHTVKLAKRPLTFIGNDSQRCRVCLKEGHISIYGSNSSLNIPETVKTFGDIEMSENDEYPKHLCNACYSLLQNAVLFRKCAKETDLNLRQYSETLQLPLEDFNDAESSENNYRPEIDNCHKVITKSYNCKLCKLSFQSSDDYMAHKNSKQHRNVRVQCPICFGLLTPQLYKRHLERHQSATHLICEVCGKMYRKDNLIRHLQLHSFKLPFQCELCPYRGRFMESLKIHMRTHTGVKPFSCDKCYLRFLTRSNLNRHILTHKKEKPYKCIECGRGFYTKRDLDVHFKSDHVGVKDYNCKLCGNKYGTRKALMRHELRVHKRDKLSKGRMPLYLQEEYRKQSDET